MRRLGPALPLLSNSVLQVEGGEVVGDDVLGCPPRMAGGCSTRTGSPEPPRGGDRLDAHLKRGDLVVCKGVSISHF